MQIIDLRFGKATALPLLVFLLLLDVTIWTAQLSAADTISDKGGQTMLRPGDDFYDYVNGDWLAQAVIPDGEEKWGPGVALAESTKRRSLQLIAAIDSAASDDERKLADFYQAMMDQDGIEAKGLAPIKPLLKSIAAIRDKTGLAQMLGASIHSDIESATYTNFDGENLFGLWIGQGFDDPKHYSAYLLQGGLGLPDRSYYDSDDPHMAELRIKYQQHIETIFKLIGLDHAERRAALVYGLEALIAQTHASREDSDDEWKAHNIWSKNDFAAKAPGLDWPAFFKSAGLGMQTSLVVWHPGAIVGSAKLVGQIDLQTWKDFLTLHLVDHLSMVLPKVFADEHVAFFDSSVQGNTNLPDRASRSLEALNLAMPDAVGRLYVEHYFPAAEKARVQNMVVQIKAAYRKHIDDLQWMSPETRQQAQAKLNALYIGVGYPEHWNGYGGLSIAADDALGNQLRAEKFHSALQLYKLGREVDHQEWSMSANQALALNLGMQNQLNFAAAYLQPPYFDPQAGDAANYGAVGAIIGHEISHMFDQTGSRFDADGRLRNWWSSADQARFKAALAPLARQYSGYAPLPALHIDGQRTLTENAADLVGLDVAFHAYRAALGDKSATPDQDRQFFIGFAQMRRVKLSDAALKRQIATDTHAPPKYRIQTVRNLDAWYDAFDVGPGQALYLAPEQRVSVR